MVVKRAILRAREEPSMQIRCYNCHKPYALGREAVREALDLIHKEGLSHFDAPCPHCRRVNRLAPDALKRAAPDWKKPDQETVNE